MLEVAGISAFYGIKTTATLPELTGATTTGTSTTATANSAGNATANAIALAFYATGTGTSFSQPGMHDEMTSGSIRRSQTCGGGASNGYVPEMFIWYSAKGPDEPDITSMAPGWSTGHDSAQV